MSLRQSPEPPSRRVTLKHVHEPGQDDEHLDQEGHQHEGEAGPEHGSASYSAESKERRTPVQESKVCAPHCKKRIAWIFFRILVVKKQVRIIFFVLFFDDAQQ